MIQLGPVDIGRVESIASLTVTTAVVTKLAVGAYDSQYLEGYWMLRPDTATAADRRRVVDSFAAATGTLTHTGANYGDTTATSELIEIWKYDPEWVDLAINTALTKMRRAYAVYLPAIHGARMHFLDSLAGIAKPSDIMRIERTNSRQLTNNRFFDEYWTVNTSGVLQPDYWTLAGSGATMARSTTRSYRSKYAIAITRAGADCTLTQDVGMLWNGVSGEDLSGKAVEATGAFWSAVASQVRIGINDGVTTTYSSYHTGGSTWERLNVSKTLSASATKCEVTISVEGSDTVCYANDVFLSWEQVQAVDQRLDESTGLVWDREYSQSESLPVMLPPRSLGEVWKVWIARSYPQFNEDRVRAGTADDDSTDAPLDIVAIGALAELYFRVAAGRESDSSTEYMLAQKYESSFNTMRANLLTMPDINRGHPLGQPMYHSLAGARGL